MLSIGGWQVHQIWTVLREQRLTGEVCAKPTSANDHWTMLLKLDSALLVHDAHNSFRRSGQKLRGLRLRDDTRNTIGPLRNLLHHLDQCICDSHTREAFR